MSPVFFHNNPAFIASRLFTSGNVYASSGGGGGHTPTHPPTTNPIAQQQSTRPSSSKPTKRGIQIFTTLAFRFEWSDYTFKAVGGMLSEGPWGMVYGCNKVATASLHTGPLNMSTSGARKMDHTNTHTLIRSGILWFGSVASRHSGHFKCTWYYINLVVYCGECKS